jgi:tetratricopeptide (TPR) repeat protein
MELAGFLQRGGHDAEARDGLRAAVRRADRFMSRDPSWAPYRDAFASSLGTLSKLVSKSANPEMPDVCEALSLAARAVELSPKSGDAWNVVGEAHFRAGHWDEAIDAIVKAGELRSPAENVTGWFHLAMAHWQKGETVNARAWYDKAAEWMANNRFDNDEFIRLRDEASAMLGVTDGLAVTGNKEKNTRGQSEP